MSDIINVQLSPSEIKELDDALFATIRRMLREGVTSAERHDNALKHLISAETKIHEQVFGNLDSQRMKEIRHLVSESDVI